jgi:aspartate-semialdehyde dehydrogenase
MTTADSLLRRVAGPIAVVGATGAVGREALAILAARNVPADNVLALASARSAGSVVPYGEGGVVVRELSESLLQSARIAIFTATSDIARCFARPAAAQGVVVVDNSSALRHEPDVPLVIPEINAHELSASTRLVANPNCSTILLLMALEPLRRRWGVERIDVSTYQAVSGAGAAGIDELLRLTRVSLEPASGDEHHAPRVFHEPCAFNVFSHNSAVDVSTGLNAEEVKIIREARRIWNLPTLSIAPTCVRVPVIRAHAESVLVTLREPAAEAAVREAIAAFPGLRLVDDRAHNRFPTSRAATGEDDVLVGRIRPDPSETLDAGGAGVRRYQLFLAGDQIRKGAALNAVQIAEKLIELGAVRLS